MGYQKTLLSPSLGFNEAAANSPRKYPGRRALRLRAERFNEAAANSPRKSPMRGTPSPWRQCFNEAAANSPRKLLIVEFIEAL